MSDDGRGDVREERRDEERSGSPPRGRSPSPPRREEPNEDAKLFIGNLSFETTGDDLNDLFSRYGKVVEARVCTDRDSGRPRGFGFVSYENAADAVAAIDALNGHDLQGRDIRVDKTNKSAGRSRDDRGRGGYGGRDRGFGGRDRGYGDRDRGFGDRDRGYGRDDRRDDRGDRDRGYGRDDRRDDRGDRDRGYGGRDDRRDDRGPRGGSRGACYAFQKGECRYGSECRFSHE